MKRQIRFYSRKASFSEFSNFSPFGFEEDGVFWPTVEHYFQAAKFPGNPDYQERIRTAKSPSQARALGRSRSVAIRGDWDSVKEDVMQHALRRKFEDPRLRDLLLSTGKKELIEDSPRDKYWGCGRDGKGRNRLGVLLMEIREKIRGK